MIKVSVLYPYSDRGAFDFEYYRDKHMPLIKECMGDDCLRYTIDKGLTGAAPGSNPDFVAACHIYCESVEKFYGAFGPHQKKIMADVPNYTDIKPVMQVSEVVAEAS